jgi:D-alanine-D-alanine ligase
MPFFLGCMHGNFGENGALQALLEARRLAFTGSGARASALAFDKVAAKAVVAGEGGAVLDGRVLPPRAPDVARVLLNGMFERHGRIVVKPVADGSSVGLVHVRNVADVERAIQQLSDNPDVAYLADVFAVGRELTVGVVEQIDGPLRALPPSEVILDDGHDFDFAGKYLGVGTREITPAVADPAVLEAAQALAMCAHRALGCAGYSRTDMIVTDRGPVFLETNTLPGLTKASFLPQQLAVLGIELRGFFADQLALAITRAGR